MNVCILSMQRIDNMGSLLQAYALKKILEDLGLEVAYLDIKIIKDAFLRFPSGIEIRWTL